jgi:hypothetical protein
MSMSRMKGSKPPHVAPLRPMIRPRMIWGKKCHNPREIEGGPSMPQDKVLFIALQENKNEIGENRC